MINLDESDLDADIKKKKQHATKIPIWSMEQFQFMFGEEYTKEATELLCDVYNGRHWYVKIVDIDGKVRVIRSYQTDEFISMMTKLLKRSERFWMELHTGSTSFNKDWTINIEDDVLLFNNIQDGMRPISSFQALSIINSMVPLDIFIEKENFMGTVMKSGNSLVVKVTEPCRRMGIDVGDEVSITFETNKPENDIELPVFVARNWAPITNLNELCHHNDCDLKLVEKFLVDFNIIGTVDSHQFAKMSYDEKYCAVFDHMNYFKDSKGSNIVVTQPYDAEGVIELAKDWSHKNGCTVEEHKGYSWRHPPKTTLLIFKRKMNPDWKIPSMENKISYFPEMRS